MPDDITFLALKSQSDAVRAHRRATAETNEFNALIAETDTDAAQRLAEARPDRPAETGALLQQRSPEAERRRQIATSTRELAGLKESDFPWKRWADDIKSRLAGAEEQFVQSQDQAENAEAYGVDPDEADFTLELRRADVQALQALHTRVLAKVPTAPNRASRRGGRSTPPATE